ncbi:MAG: queuosine precursor transporter [Caldilineaceae bacterium]
MKAYKLLPIITAAFVTVLLISNIASTKILIAGPFTFDGGTILFPLSYIFGDILTEVYGYKNSRTVIWTGFGCLVVMALTLAVVDALPPAADWTLQDSFHAILGQAPRIVIASLLAYWGGEFVNSYILAKIKLWTEGRYLWLRTISSTIFGEGFDTIVFILVAFWGTMPNDLIWTIFVSNYIFKVGVEVILTPITYLIVGWLKAVEHEDYYDRDTDFNPFAVG